MLFPAAQFYPKGRVREKGDRVITGKASDVYLVLGSGAVDDVLGSALVRGCRDVDLARGVDVLEELRRYGRDGVVLVRDVRELRSELDGEKVTIRFRDPTAET